MLMMKSIAQEVAPHRIRVNSIAPGAIRTPINMQAWDTPEHYAELLKLIPTSESASRKRSGAPRPGWPATNPITSRARRCMSTAA